METLLKLGSIGAGGFVGAILRFLVSGLVQARSGSVFFPWGTMTVNMIGCLLIGFLSVLLDSRQLFSHEVRSFFLIGLLGAFTTFSTFGYENLALIESNRVDLAAFNGGVQLVLGVLLVWLGRFLATLWS
ncbi:MAG: fluoride efflux transporter CrcB [Desulfobulbus propionicus]|nr:MAG: fluoride efflux transporter CrcB [Desulfobulbus propionicus]